MQVISIRLGVPTAIEGGDETLLANLPVVQPTWMGAVPLVFEEIYAAILAEARAAGRARWRVFQWALAIGSEVSQVRQQRRALPAALAVQHVVADRLVFSRVRARFGGRLRFLISGGAPLSPHIAEFFHACGVLVLEGYGLTESSAASCLNTLHDYAFGTVGRPVPGTELRIAPDGEILLRGRGVMKGYLGLPDETAAVLDEQGWLHTGDIGIVQDNGHLRITDRKKELIVTAGGKNIAPAHFQNLLKARSVYVAEVLMHGDRRPYCTALVAIDPDAVGAWAKSQGMTWRDHADLARRPEVAALVQADVDAVNKELPAYEAVKRVAILPERLSVEAGTLTASLKVKRRVVEERYSDLLDRLYEGTVAKV
jgi:long-chain acyl-CoA synthetase